MPALLTRTSSAPNSSITLAIPASTCCSSATSMATPMAELPPAAISRAVASAALEVGDGDHGALAGENGGDLFSDSAGRAGDDGDLVLQTHGSLLKEAGPQARWSWTTLPRDRCTV